MPRTRKRMGAASIAVGVGLSALGAGSLFAPTAGLASSHREAPLTAAEPQIDGTDLYAFVSPDKSNTVTLVSNWIPNQQPAGGPNFYPWAPGVRYDINIDNNGDAKADVIYRWVFTSHYRNPDTFLYATGPVTSLTDRDLNFYQTYDLTEIDVAANGSKTTKTLLNDAISAPSDVGQASMPSYRSLRSMATRSIEGGTGKTYAGQADDPFFLDLRVFDLLYGGNFKESGADLLSGYNVNTLALQVPKSDLASRGNATANPIIGVWTTAERQNVRVQTSDGKVDYSGSFVQVSRLGNPLVNEVVVPVGAKDYFNASKPQNDAQFLGKVTNPELPQLIEKVYGLKAPATPRNDLVAVFLTGVPGLNKPANVKPSEQLRLNMSIAPAAAPNRLGVIGGDTAGFPNGRRLSDDVVDIALQVVEGELVGRPNDLSDGVDVNDRRFESSFPYVAAPHRGSSIDPHEAPGPSGAALKGTSSLSRYTTAAAVQVPGRTSAGTDRTVPATAAIAGLLFVGIGVVTRRRSVRA